MVKHIYITFLVLMMPWHVKAEDWKCPASVTVNGDAIYLPPGWKSSTHRSATPDKTDLSFTRTYALSDIHLVQYDDIDFLPPSRKLNGNGVVEYLWQLTNDNEYEMNCDYNESRIRLYNTLPSGLKTCEAVYKNNENGKLIFNAAKCY